MFHPFALEQWMSDNEPGVAYHFAESGVHPLSFAELMDAAGRAPEDLADIRLDYPQVSGTKQLREHIAALYPDTHPDEVLVTVGASEANALVAQELLSPADEVLTLSPTYRQLSGNARNLGVIVRETPLVEASGWALDAERLADTAGPSTRMLAIVNPNNPTGHILTEAEMGAVVAAADRTGAWIVADEVYAGPSAAIARRHRRSAGGTSG